MHRRSKQRSHLYRIPENPDRCEPAGLNNGQRMDGPFWPLLNFSVDKIGLARVGKLEASGNLNQALAVRCSVIIFYIAYGGRKCSFLVGS